jgi:hypothetical protein
MKRRTSKKPKATPYHLCGECSSGFRIIIRDGERFAARCACWSYRFIAPPITDRKTIAAGQ